MPSFTPGNQDYEPFGRNEYKASTKNLRFVPRTLAASTVPTETIDGYPQKVLQSGELLALITSGPEQGKVGPFRAGATDGRQTLANVVGINETFAPWQLLYRDIEVSVCVEGALNQARCFERDAAGARIALTNTQAAGLVAQKSIDIKFQ